MLLSIDMIPCDISTATIWSEILASEMREANYHLTHNIAAELVDGFTL